MPKGCQQNPLFYKHPGHHLALHKHLSCTGSLLPLAFCQTHLSTDLCSLYMISTARINGLMYIYIYIHTHIHTHPSVQDRIQWINDIYTHTDMFLSRSHSAIQSHSKDCSPSQWYVFLSALIVHVPCNGINSLC
jgi:hypothetical protein